MVKVTAAVLKYKSRDRSRAAMAGTTAGLLVGWEAARLSECDSHQSQMREWKSIIS